MVKVKKYDSGNWGIKRSFFDLHVCKRPFLSFIVEFAFELENSNLDDFLVLDEVEVYQFLAILRILNQFRVSIKDFLDLFKVVVNKFNSFFLIYNSRQDFFKGLLYFFLNFLRFETPHPS
jgi:hypothetical protein